MEFAGGMLPLPEQTRVGPYVIERRLGSGGMGVVYLGRDRGAGTAAAVKLIRAEYAGDPVLRARLRREVRAARRVPRFCTAAVLDADVDAGQPWVATEYIEGPTLEEALLQGGRLTATALEAFAIGVAVALRAIHGQGVVHRDLKPSNIVLSRFGPRVIDFGIAQLDDAPTRITRAGALVGTPAYMAPEQVLGAPVTTAVDVFAWASVVTYAATGRPPFGTGNVPLRSVVQDQPDLGDLAGPLRELVAAAFTKDPAGRPSTSDLVERLTGIAPVASSQVLATADAAPAVPAATGVTVVPQAPTQLAATAPPRARPRRRRLVLVAAAATAVVVVAAAAGAVALARGDGATTAGPDEARSRELAARSLEHDLTDPRRSMELALDAWAAAPTSQARGALLSAYTYPYDGQLGTGPGGSAVAVTPDGALVAVGRPDGTVQLWDVATRQPAGEPLAGHGDTVYRVEFSPDGDLLASASLETDEDGWPLGLNVWDVDSRELVRTLPATAPMVWLPDGSALAGFTLRPGEDEAVVPTLAIWDAVTGREQATIPTGDLLVDAAVSPDGRWVAGGRTDGTVGVWRLEGGGSVAELDGYASDSSVRVAFLSRDQVATVGVDGAVKLWELPGAGKPRILDEGGDRTIGRLAPTADGFLLATGAGTPLDWWEPDSGWQFGQLVGFEGTPLDVAVSADGKLVVAAGRDGATTLWRRATRFLPHPAGLSDVAYAPDGDRLAAAGMDGVVRVWDTTTAAVTATIGHDAQTRSVAYAPDGTLVSTSLDGTVRLTGPGGQRLAELSVGEGRAAGYAAFSPGGELLAVVAEVTGGAEGRYEIHVWEADGLWPRGVIDTGDADPAALAFTPDGDRLLAAAYTNFDLSGDVPGHSELVSWRTDDLAEADRVDLGEQQAVHLAVSPDGATAAVGGTARGVELHSVAGAAGPPRRIAEHPATIRRMAFSPDGRILATITAGDNLARLWDAATGEPVASLVGHGDTPNAIAFSPDGRTLASAGPDGFVGLWTTDPRVAIDRICAALADPTADAHPLCS